LASDSIGPGAVPRDRIDHAGALADICYLIVARLMIAVGESGLMQRSSTDPRVLTL
jgi:hypothetical protein